MQVTSMTPISPSFTHNSSNHLADIAARVIEEFRIENGHQDDDDIYNFAHEDENEVYVYTDTDPDGNFVNNSNKNENENEDEQNKDKDSESDFEFDIVCTDPSSVPRYPLFDQSLLLNYVVSGNSDPDIVPVSESVSVSPAVRQPLAKLFREERETASCSSVPEVDNLAGVAPETYCIWKPKVESPEKCKKSNSTGNSSKRWKFRNLLQRSNSDGRLAAGKQADFSHFPATKKKAEKVKKVDKTAKVAGSDDDGEIPPVTDEVNRFRSYFRRKTDQAGVFANVSGLNRSE